MAALSERRRQLLGLAHVAAHELGWDEAFRRQRQLAVTGHASCRDMSDAELVGWLWHLRELGSSIHVPAQRLGGSGQDRPTAWQWVEIERLAVQLGFKGLDDAGLNRFCYRTVHVSALRMINRQQASAVISGLRRWLRQKTERRAQGAA